METEFNKMDLYFIWHLNINLLLEKSSFKTKD